MKDTLGLYQSDKMGTLIFFSGDASAIIYKFPPPPGR